MIRVVYRRRQLLFRCKSRERWVESGSDHCEKDSLNYGSREGGCIDGAIPAT
jgi:hypothetical protein